MVSEMAPCKIREVYMGSLHGGSGIADQASTMEKQPTIVTITVSTNEARWLPQCLGSLLASQLDGIEAHFLLIDNACTDDTAELVRTRFPQVRLIRSPHNLGFAAANNIGLRYAVECRADFVLLVNPDTRTPPDLLRQLVGFMWEWPEYGIVGPLQYHYTADGAATDELNEWSQGALAVGEAHAYVHAWPDRPSPAGPPAGRAPRTLEHAYVQGSALLCRVEVLRRIGLFDAAYHTYYEETDLCRRTRWAGWRVALLLDQAIQHFGGGGTRASLYRRRKMLRNKYYFLFSDPEWSGPDAARLALRWLRIDLRRGGAAPAPTIGGALADTALGLLWLIGRTPRIAGRRRAHRRLWRDGADGPLRVRSTDTPKGQRSWLATS